jgi:glycosyltransferase involved in cell wall biosynthesis
VEISYHTHKDNFDLSRGFGAAGFRVVTSLQQLGHSVAFDDSSAPVQLSFNQPQAYKFHDGQYRIGYTPWESTNLPNGWKKIMNNCDEVWATSEWVADVFESCGVTKPIYVYEHGLDKRWSPKKREVGDVLKFLHVGEPALRKGGQLAIDAFRETFGDREDVHLTVKAQHQHYLRVWHEGKVTSPEDIYNNVTVTTEQYTFDEMRQLYYDHDVFIYPSYGEGFGFIPLQALGTGMPVVSTYAWAPYKKYLKEYGLSGSWNRSIWSLHPGNVIYPDYNQLRMRMQAFSNSDFREHANNQFYKLATSVHEEYDWLKKTKDAFEHLGRFTKS